MMNGDMMNGMMGGHGSSYLGPLGLLLQLVFWTLIIAGVVLIAKWLIDQGRPASTSGGGSALEILKQRYARGEIDREEYQTKRADLLGD